MKITSTLTLAVVSALVGLTPLSAATVDSGSLAVAAANDAADSLDARDVSSCSASAPRKNRHHHKKKKKGGKKQKNKSQYVEAKVSSASPSHPASAENKNIKDKHHKKIGARPSHYYSPNTQKTTQNAKTTPQKTVTNTGSTGTTGTTTNNSGNTVTTSPSSTLSSFEQTMLDMHNADRAKHSASPLTWSPTLASAAASWASGCKWQHTPNNPYGQNIAAGTASNFGAKDSCTMWYDEISQYNFAKGLYSDATGHFTQMVWKGSKKLGCAIQECSASQMGLGSSGSAKYVVCNYDPPGNVIGQFLQNVLLN